MASDETKRIVIGQQKPDRLRDVMTLAYDALTEKGYDAINQIVGYILSEDPTYITTHKNARNEVRTISRDELLRELVKFYLAR